MRVSALLGILFLTACGGGSPSTQVSDEALGTVETRPAPQGVRSLALVYVEWPSGIASAHVVAALLADQLGYQVELSAVEAGTMWRLLATGEADATVTAWLPEVHGRGFAGVRERVVDLGANLEGTRVGLAVPAFTDLDRIEEVAGHVEALGATIHASDAILAPSRLTAALAQYGLDFTAEWHRDDTLASLLSDRIRSKQWVVVSGARPHRVFARHDLVFLDDPRGAFGAPGRIHTVVRAGLEQEHPEAHVLLDAFAWDLAEVEAVMAANHDAITPDAFAAARDWIRHHPDRVSRWLPR